MSDAPTLRVEVRLKNARLLEAIRAYPLPPLKGTPRLQLLQRLGPVRAFCRLHGLQYESVGALITLRHAPHSRRTGHPRKVVERLCAIFEQPVAWLFPEDLYQMTWPRLLATDVAPQQFEALTSAPTSALLLPPSQEENVLAQELRTALDQAVQMLTPREALVIRARFGLDGNPPESLESIGKWLTRGARAEVDPGGVGIDKERVRQIEAKALRKLRHPSYSRRLHPFIDTIEVPYKEIGV